MAEQSDRSPVAAKIERELRRRIVQGVYAPHLYLPSERQLAGDLRASRVTVGKALAALERDGLVLRSQGRGTRVLPASETASRLPIGIVHGEFVAMRAAEYRGSLSTLQGARETLERLACDHELMSVPRDHGLPADHLLDRFGAMLFIESCCGEDQYLAEFERRGVPVVVAKLEDDLDVSATWVDHQEPTLQAVRTLVGLGHRRIAFVGREANHVFHGPAREAFLSALRQAGLPIDKSLIASCEKTDALSGYFAAKPLLRSSEPPTAIVAARDAIAEGVCRAIQEAGLVVGRHVSAIGFDDATWPEGRDFLTTFREPCYEMGKVAAEMLIERIVNPSLGLEKRRLKTPFILRRSAGPPMPNWKTRPERSAANCNLESTNAS